MKNLFNPTDSQEILDRIKKLTPETQRLCGKMDVAQMLAHCTKSIRVARGIDNPPRRFIGVLLSWIMKDSFFGEKPYPKNSPTDKDFIIADKRVFEQEKNTLVEHVKAFASGGAEKCTKNPSPFFGKLTPEEWARGQYRHLDHHLGQFGA
jgi:uncharacterized protein YifE (UPF0438 family)